MTTKKLAGYKELPLCVLEDADRLIARLTKQRAELLEALKVLKKRIDESAGLSMNELELFDSYYSEVIDAAIKNAERDE